MNREQILAQDFIASLVDGRVDVIDREGLKPTIGPAVTAEAVYAF